MYCIVLPNVIYLERPVQHLVGLVLKAGHSCLWQWIRNRDASMPHPHYKPFVTRLAAAGSACAKSVIVILRFQRLNDRVNNFSQKTNKSLMSMHTPHTLPHQKKLYTHTHTYTKQSKPPAGDFNGFSGLCLHPQTGWTAQSTQLMSAMLPFFFFSFCADMWAVGCGHFCRSLLSGYSHV